MRPSSARPLLESICRAPSTKSSGTSVTPHPPTPPHTPTPLNGLMSSIISGYPDTIDDEIDEHPHQKFGLERFLYNGPLDTALGFSPAHLITPAEKTALELRQTSLRFAIKIDIENDNICCTVDRAAVLAVYQDTLKLLEQPRNKQDHIRILSEATHRVRIILGIISAHPLDAAFSTTGQLLKPLEPQYSEPRISLKNDKNQHRAQWRLTAWRNDGWPNTYPARAVKKELEGNASLTGNNKISLWNLKTKWQEEDMGGEDEGKVEDETAVQPDAVEFERHRTGQDEGDRADDDDILNDIWD